MEHDATAIRHFLHLRRLRVLCLLLPIPQTLRTPQLLQRSLQATHLVHGAGSRALQLRHLRAELLEASLRASPHPSQTPQLLNALITHANLLLESRGLDLESFPHSAPEYETHRSLVVHSGPNDFRLPLRGFQLLLEIRDGVLVVDFLLLHLQMTKEEDDKQSSSLPSWSSSAPDSADSPRPIAIGDGMCRKRTLLTACTWLCSSFSEFLS